MIAPAGKDLWIAVSTLNQLRRQDPTKVEPLWNDQYAVLLSWFGENSPYSLLQHTGTMGYVLSALLGNSGVLRSLMVLSMAGAALLLLPLLEYIANRALVSSYLWLKWATWARITRSPLPLQLFLAQILWKQAGKVLGRVEKRVRDFLVLLECELLDNTIPLTVGPGSERVTEGYDASDRANDDDDDDEMLDDDSDDDDDE